MLHLLWFTCDVLCFFRPKNKKGARPCASLERSTCRLGVCPNADKGASFWLCCIADPTASMLREAGDLELCPIADKGARLLLSRLMIMVWNGGLRLDGVPGGKAPASLGGLELVPGLCVCGFVNHGPATRLAKIAKGLPPADRNGISQLDASITTRFRILESGAGLVWCGHHHGSHTTNAHQGCPCAPLRGGRGARRRGNRDHLRVV